MTKEGTYLIRRWPIVMYAIGSIVAFVLMFDVECAIDYFEELR